MYTLCVYINYTCMSAEQGCTFLCVFGLPHAKHEDDSTRALKTAREIFNSLNHLELKYKTCPFTCTWIKLQLQPIMVSYVLSQAIFHWGDNWSGILWCSRPPSKA